MKRLGAIVLCGGRSRRMGRPKSELALGPESMLGRVVRLLASRVDLVVVAAAEDQRLPHWPQGVDIVRDPRPDRGPLQGLAVGLSALAGRVEWAFVSGTDTPLIAPGWIALLADRADDCDLVMPRVDGRDHPLSALYRVSASLPAVEAMLRDDHLRLGLVRESLRTRIVPEGDLRAVDPDLLTLRNVNTPEDYRAILSLFDLRDAGPPTADEAG